MQHPTDYSSVHYMVLPAPRFWNSPSELNFKLSFSGIALLGMLGKPDNSWNRDTLQLSIDQMRIDKLIERVRTLLPALPAGANAWTFVPLQWTVNAGVNSQFNKDTSVNAGFAVDNFRIFRGNVRANENTTQQISVMQGLHADLAVRDKDGIIYRVGYHLDVYGYFVPYFIPPIE